MLMRCPHCQRTVAAPATACPVDGARIVPDRVGTRFAGRYRIETLLGAGGMGGCVWLAHDVDADRPVALKLLPGADAEASERFERGARLAAGLDHPNICRVDRHGFADGSLYLAMDYLGGHTLADLLRGGAMAPWRAVRLIDQVLGALEHAHAHQVVHRDLKPDNLFVVHPGTPEESVRVLDFGIARFADGVEAPGVGGVAIAELTDAQQICGTPQYMAPEQILRGPIDGRSDLYALAVVAYRMLSGRLPFEAVDTHGLLRAHVQDEAPWITTVTGAISDPLAEWIHQGLAKQPADRFADAGEMRRALQGLPLLGEGGAVTGLPVKREDTPDRLGPPRAAVDLPGVPVHRVEPAPTPTPVGWDRTHAPLETGPPAWLWMLLLGIVAAGGFGLYLAANQSGAVAAPVATDAAVP